jgi:hypothetical protein
MKKLIYIAFAALAALTACTKVEMDSYAPQRKVTFQVASYAPQTKANSSMWTLGSSPSFTAKAFLHADGYTGETQNFFGAGETITPYQTDGTAATAESNTSYWGPSHDYYWPKSSNSYINFIAWRGATPATATETSLSWTDYTVQSTDDLVYADEAWHYNVNTTNASQYTDDAVTSGVPMLFHHALAKLCIEAKVAETTKENKTGGAGLGNTNWEVTLSNIKLDGIYTTGNLVLTNTEPAGTASATSEWQGGWTPTGSTTTINMTAVDTPLDKTNATTILAMQSVLPQTVTNAVVLSFDYNIDTKFNTSKYAQEKIHASIQLNSASAVTGPISSWDMNKKVTYTIIIDPVTTTIKIDPAMVDWVVETGGTATL